MVARLRQALAFLALAFLFAAKSINAEPHNGWWWNPSESGRGFFIEMTGGVMYLAGYFYDTDGRATWLSSGGPVTDLYSYRGTLQSYHDGQSVFGTYRPPAPAVDVGPVNVTFSDDTHGTLTWPGGTVQIERQQFGESSDVVPFDPFTPVAPPVRPKTGWWWNSDESGSGYSVEIQGNHLFVVAFMYTESGEPVWYFSAGPMSSPTHFESDWLELSGGQTLGGPYRLPTSRMLGRVTIDFAAQDSATIVFSEGSSTASAATAPKFIKAGTKRSRTSRAAPQLPRQFWRASDFPPYFFCRYFQEVNTIGEAGSEGGLFTTNRTTSFDLVFKLSTRSFLDGRIYDLQPGSTYTYVYDDHDTSNGCRGHATKSGAIQLKGTLAIVFDLHYSLYVEDRGALLLIPVTLHTDSCVNVESQPADTTTYISLRVTDPRFKGPGASYGNTVQPSGAPGAYSLSGFVPELSPENSYANDHWNCSSSAFPPL
jgi:hypothetical protein